MAHENQVPTKFDGVGLKRERERERDREASTNYCLSSITHTVWPVDLVQVNCSPHVKSVLERWKTAKFLSRFISSSSSTSMDDEKCQYNHKYAFSEVQFSAFSACIGRKNPPTKEHRESRQIKVS